MPSCDDFWQSPPIYIPILYILKTNKSQQIYRNALEWVLKLSERQINPKTIMWDFELALMNAIQGFFLFTKINGCLFHWKQAIRRKFISLMFSNEKEILKITMQIYSMDVITLIPVNEMKKWGSWLWRTIWKTHLMKKMTRKNGSFFALFLKYWVSCDEFIKACNIHHCVGNKNTLKHTNNGIERYDKISEIFVSFWNSISCQICQHDERRIRKATKKGWSLHE